MVDALDKHPVVRWRSDSHRVLKTAAFKRSFYGIYARRHAYEQFLQRIGRGGLSPRPVATAEVPPASTRNATWHPSPRKVVTELSACLPSTVVKNVRANLNEVGYDDIIMSRARELCHPQLFKSIGIKSIGGRGSSLSHSIGRCHLRRESWLNDVSYDDVDLHPRISPVALQSTALQVDRYQAFAARVCEQSIFRRRRSFL
ncbi:hypothetical protein V8D89_004364, partial [Ganoderma adspersum]